MIDLVQALDYVPASTLDYHEWIEVGMGIKDAGYDVSVWDDWSRNDTRYKNGDCDRRWNGFQGSGITKGTIVKMAMDNGFKPASESTYNAALDWDDVIEFDGEGAAQQSGVAELIRYLTAVFKPDEHVNYVVSSFKDEDGKYKPSGCGSSGRTRDQLIEELRGCNEDIGAVLGDWDHDAGAWIRINPVDGTGVKNNNVTDFRYALIESDDVPVDLQLKFIYDKKLPCAAIVSSAGKSVHAIMRVDAKDLTEYNERVRWIHKVLSDMDFAVDGSNKNPARLSRLPGVDRGDKHQGLIDVNVGYKSFVEWQDYVKNGMEDEELPDVESLTEVWDNMPDLAPELIEGVLRQGHKLLITGASKSGKSYLLIELAIAIAEGAKWLNFNCRKGKVLYINLEIDSASFFNRIKNVYDESGISPDNIGNIDVWNLRGKAVPMVKLTPKLIRRAKARGYSAIILDPIYKVQDGDENSAGEISKFTNEFDKVATELGCSMIYCHHHSKGSQSGKRSADRASGSGVFARDADAILDMIELSNETFRNKEGFADFTAWRLESTLREFRSFKPFNLFFRYPVHELDDNHLLDNAQPMDVGIDKARGSIKSTEEKKADRMNELENAFEMTKDDNGWTTLVDLSSMLGVKPDTIRKRITEFNEENGKVFTRSGTRISRISSE